MEVEILSRKLVKPSTPTPPHLRSHKLSLLDQLAPPIYVRLIFYYSPDDGDGDNRRRDQRQAKRCTRLQTSLSEALTKYYPLAGRIRKYKLLVDCRDQGVDYLEARVRGGPLDIEFLHGDVSRMKLQDQFVPWDIGPVDSVNSTPLLAVQVNMFDCGGGLVVGVCASHKVADASSIFALMNCWASLCAREGAANNITTEPFLAPRLDYKWWY